MYTTSTSAADGRSRISSYNVPTGDGSNVQGRYFTTDSTHTTNNNDNINNNSMQQIKYKVKFKSNYNRNSNNYHITNNNNDNTNNNQYYGDTNNLQVQLTNDHRGKSMPRQSQHVNSFSQRNKGNNKNW